MENLLSESEYVDLKLADTKNLSDLPFHPLSHAYCCMHNQICKIQTWFLSDDLSEHSTRRKPFGRSYKIGAILNISMLEDKNAYLIKHPVCLYSYLNIFPIYNNSAQKSIFSRVQNDFSPVLINALTMPPVVAGVLTSNWI